MVFRISIPFKRLQFLAFSKMTYFRLNNRREEWGYDVSSGCLDRGGDLLSEFLIGLQYVFIFSSNSYVLIFAFINSQFCASVYFCLTRF